MKHMIVMIIKRSGEIEEVNLTTFQKIEDALKCAKENNEEEYNKRVGRCYSCLEVPNDLKEMFIFLIKKYFLREDIQSSLKSASDNLDDIYIGMCSRMRHLVDLKNEIDNIHKKARILSNKAEYIKQ